MNRLALVLLLVAGPASAEPADTWIHATAGPAFATYYPIDDGGIAEHLATGATEIGFGVGRGLPLGPVRLDLGLRAQHLHVGIEGSYSQTELGADYRANYDYLAFLAEGTFASHWASRVNATLGLTLGTATLFSDRKGEPLRNHQLPIYGTFEAGVRVRLVDGIDATGALSLVPPVAKVSVFSPQVGLRVRL